MHLLEAAKSRVPWQILSPPHLGSHSPSVQLPRRPSRTPKLGGSQEKTPKFERGCKSIKSRWYPENCGAQPQEWRSPAVNTGFEPPLTAGTNTTNQTKTKPKPNTGTLRVSKWQTKEIQKRNSIVRILDALCAGDLSVARSIRNKHDVLMPGSNPAPQICAPRVIVQKSKSLPTFAVRDLNRGNEKVDRV